MADEGKLKKFAELTNVLAVVAERSRTFAEVVAGMAGQMGRSDVVDAITLMEYQGLLAPTDPSKALGDGPLPPPGRAIADGTTYEATERGRRAVLAAATIRRGIALGRER